MTYPSSLKEYSVRFQRNTVTRGFGTETTIDMACPFCAAAGWISCSLPKIEKMLCEPTMCRACGRSAKAIFTRDSDGARFEMVQTGGDDQPDWLEPKMRRV